LEIAMHSTKWLMMVAGVGLCTLLVDANRAEAQRFGPPRGGGFDPESRWADLTQSTGGSGDTLQLERLPPDARERLRRLATFTGQAPLPESGILTKAQYIDYVQRGIQGMKEKGMGGGEGGGPGMGGPGMGGPGGPPRTGFPNNSSEDILSRFQEYDKNQDGKLSMDEAPTRTRGAFANFDANKDGLLDLQEYTQLRQSVYAMPSGGPPGASGAPPGKAMNIAAPAWPQTPTPAVAASSTSTVTAPANKTVDPTLIAYRYGKIPKEAPTWFSDLDTDKDGQIGMYEWKKAGRDMAEFAALDLNNDGFVTPEEWLRAQKLTQERQKNDELVASVTENNTVPEAISGSRSSLSEGTSRGPWGSRSSKDKEGSDRKDNKRGFPFKK